MLLVGAQGADRDRPIEGRGIEGSVDAVVAGRSDQDDVAVPVAEVTKGERGPVVTGVGSCGKVDQVRREVGDQLFELLDDHILQFAAGLREVIADVDGGPGCHAPRDTGYERPVPRVLRDARQAVGQDRPQQIGFPGDAIQPRNLGSVQVLQQAGVADPEPHLILARVRDRRRARLRITARHLRLIGRTDLRDVHDLNRCGQRQAAGVHRVVLAQAFVDKVQRLRDGQVTFIELLDRQYREIADPFPFGQLDPAKPAEHTPQPLDVVVAVQHEQTVGYVHVVDLGVPRVGDVDLDAFASERVLHGGVLRVEHQVRVHLMPPSGDRGRQ
jgi:hypothetical protein